MSDLPDDIALKRLRQVSIEETTKYIMKAPLKSCELDPIPMDLLKEVTHVLTPILTDLINTLLKHGTFPWVSKKLFFNHYLKKPHWTP